MNIQLYTISKEKYFVYQFQIDHSIDLYIK
jgi:hypothetical protein